MAQKSIVDVLCKLFGVASEGTLPIEKHADDVSVYQERQRGVSYADAEKKHTFDVQPCDTADEWRQCLMSALRDNDKHAAKRFLLTLQGELKGEEPKRETQSHAKK